MPTDVSTVVLIDSAGGHKKSAAVLRCFKYMGFPYSCLGPIALCMPSCLLDIGYDMFARHRGKIWKAVKRVTGWGDTYLSEFRQRIMGLEEPLDPGWGFGSDSGDNKHD